MLLLRVIACIELSSQEMHDLKRRQVGPRETTFRLGFTERTVSKGELEPPIETILSVLEPSGGEMLYWSRLMIAKVMSFQRHVSP